MSTTDYEEALRLEDDACAAVKSLAAELAVACRPISGWGDGNCGSVLDYVTEALAAAGLYVDPATRPRVPPRKQVIKPALRTQVFERDAYRCVSCSTHKDLCVDHIHPESKGGTLDLDNLQTLCRSCNSIKGDKA